MSPPCSHFTFIGMLAMFSAFSLRAADPSAADLTLLSSVAERYQVKDVTLQQALDALCKAVLPDAPPLAVQLLPPTAWAEGDKPTRITLNLKEVPARQVIDYIAELTSARWKIAGPPGYLSLALEKRSPADDANVFLHTRSFECLPASAKVLGLRKDMTGKEVREALQSYDITFPEGADAMWNPGTNLLAVRNLPDELAMVDALIRLTSRGYHLEVRRAPTPAR